MTYYAIVEPAFDTALTALREAADRENPKPLTLEELKERCEESKGIYVAGVGKSTMARGTKCRAAVLDHFAGFNTMGTHIQAIYGRNLTLAEDDYGVTWLAYAHEPKEAPHADLHSR